MRMLRDAIDTDTDVEQALLDAAHASAQATEAAASVLCTAARGSDAFEDARFSSDDSEDLDEQGGDDDDKEALVDPIQWQQEYQDLVQAEERVGKLKAELESAKAADAQAAAKSEPHGVDWRQQEAVATAVRLLQTQCQAISSCISTLEEEEQEEAQQAGAGAFDW